MATTSNATQSSNLRFVGLQADDAINGAIDPIVDFTHTDNERNPYLQLELEDAARIGQIVIFNRGNDLNIGSWIGNFRVSVFNGNPDTGGTELWGNNYSYDPNAPAVSTTSIGEGAALRIDGNTLSSGRRLDELDNARFVRVQIIGTNFLSLAEIQLWKPNQAVDLDELEYIYDVGTRDNVFIGATAITPGLAGDAFFSGDVTAIDRGANTGNFFNRDFITGTAPATFNHRVENGRYRVTLNISDPANDLDNLFVSAEDGAVEITDIDRPAGQNQTFNLFVNVNDGELNLEFGDADLVNPLWAVNRIVLSRVPTSAPGISPGGGVVAVGTEVTFQNPDTAGTIYFTTDGSDPILSDGSVNLNASSADNTTLTINSDTVVLARTVIGAQVSALASATFETHTTPDATVVGRNLFYAGSSFANDSTDDAIAPNIIPLISGRATFENYSSFNGGINGLVVDLEDVGDLSQIDTSDFVFRVGNSNDLSTFTTAPTPEIEVLDGQGVGGSDRIVLTWTDRAISSQWLQVTIAANSDTGLANEDVFYFGNAIGETGNSTTDARVDAIDLELIRANSTGFLSADIDNLFDINRDGRVDVVDVELARVNASGFTPLILLDLSGTSSISSVAILNAASHNSSLAADPIFVTSSRNETNLFSTSDFPAYTTGPGFSSFGHTSDPISNSANHRQNAEGKNYALKLNSPVSNSDQRHEFAARETPGLKNRPNKTSLESARDTVFGQEFFDLEILFTR